MLLRINMTVLTSKTNGLRTTTRFLGWRKGSRWKSFSAQTMNGLCKLLYSKHPLSNFGPRFHPPFKARGQNRLAIVFGNIHFQLKSIAVYLHFYKENCGRSRSSGGHFARMQESIFDSELPYLFYWWYAAASLSLYMSKNLVCLLWPKRRYGMDVKEQYTPNITSIVALLCYAADYSSVCHTR
jgi:hypothetical protein